MFAPAADLDFAVPHLGPLLVPDGATPGAFGVGLGADPVRGRPVALCWVPLRRAGRRAWRLDRPRLRDLGLAWCQPLPEGAVPDWFAASVPAWVMERRDAFVLLLLAYTPPRGLDTVGRSFAGGTPWMLRPPQRKLRAAAIRAQVSGVDAGPAEAAAAMQDVLAESPAEAIRHRAVIAAGWLRRIARWVRALESVRVPLGVLQLPRPAPGPAMPWSLALGSCAYPRGMLDRAPATAAWQRLNRRAHTGGGAHPALMILTGDQIYADATAGLLDPARPEDRYRRAYEALYAEPHVRSALRRVPVVALIDDHEIDDNWEPIPPPVRAAASTWDPPVETAAERAGRVHHARGQQGIEHFLRYARAAVADPSAPLWFESARADLPMFFLDTRTRRGLRNSTTLGRARMLDPALPSDQETALRAWLQRAPEWPRLVVGPPALFPRQRASAPSRLLAGADVGDAPTLRADDFSGFPALRDGLLRLIADAPLRHLVFLSGDLHLGLLATVNLRKFEQGVERSHTRIHCVHAPGLYAPYPFANAAPADLLLDETYVFEAAGARYECEVRTTLFPGSGFVYLDFGRDPAGWRMRAEFDVEPAPPPFELRL